MSEASQATALKELNKEAENYSVPRQAPAESSEVGLGPTENSLSASEACQEGSTPSLISRHLCSFLSGCDIYASNVKMEV